jgi:hypothetical protein
MFGTLFDLIPIRTSSIVSVGTVFGQRLRDDLKSFAKQLSEDEHKRRLADNQVVVELVKKEEADRKSDATVRLSVFVRLSGTDWQFTTIFDD